MVPSSLIELVPELGQTNVRIKDPTFVENSLRCMMKDAHHKLQITDKNDLGIDDAHRTPGVDVAVAHTEDTNVQIIQNDLGIDNTNRMPGVDVTVPHAEDTAVQVVADFDRTLSKYLHNGTECSTTHGALEQSDMMSEHFKTEATKLKDYYLPIEFDPSKTVEEKIPKMIEWWSKGHALLVSCGLTREKLHKIVATSNVRLRDGCVWLFSKLHQLDVPLMLFSAGIGDVISEAIKQQATFYNNMKLVSNFIHFDTQSGEMVGFTGNDVIHTFNKNENSVLNSDYFQHIKHRENILLLGDSIGDVGMATGAEKVECLLKVGFLNIKVEESLPIYLDNFDVVILQDETLDVVNGIIRVITDGATTSTTTTS